MKKCFVSFLILCSIFVLVGNNAFAQPVKETQSQLTELPKFLVDIEALQLTNAEAEDIQGTGVIYIVGLKIVAWGVRVGLNQIAKFYGWDWRFTLFSPLPNSAPE